MNRQEILEKINLRLDTLEHAKEADHPDVFDL
jgi:hypothetical protein